MCYSLSSLTCLSCGRVCRCQRSSALPTYALQLCTVPRSLSLLTTIILHTGAMPLFVATPLTCRCRLGRVQGNTPLTCGRRCKRRRAPAAHAGQLHAAGELDLAAVGAARRRAAHHRDQQRGGLARPRAAAVRRAVQQRRGRPRAPHPLDRIERVRPVPVSMPRIQTRGCGHACAAKKTWHAVVKT